MPTSEAHDWSRISWILEEALELPPEEVGRFLDRVCATDPPLRAQVERLIAADRAAAGFLEGDVAAFFPGGPASSPEPNALAPGSAGERLGPWRLIREIGRGGMGAVMLAERADGAYEQQVAIKRIRGDVNSPEALRRFDRERRILARLEHPNIARAVDGGTGPDGTPWLAMEYVPGEPITQWCAGRGETLDATIDRFEQVLRAVQFAHERFVIHRDLKPSNIFVSASGEVKLLDFGIAKLVSPDGEDAGSTIDLERRLTPHYAAPEQIRGEAVSTASDVYSLGVVLYELLSGARPYDGATGGLTEVVRRVLEEDAHPPSAALTQARAGRYRGWYDRVRGDLDNIVLKSLRQNAAERYPSAQALLDDLERWRHRLPVRATPQTRAYRARRFVARNRVAVGAGSAVALSLVAGLFAVSWQARVAAAERDRARLEAQKAQTISAFVGSIFDIANPNVAKGDTLTARGLLDQGAERARRELIGQPEVQAEILRRLAKAYHGLYAYDPAQALAEEAVEIARRTFGPESPEMLASLGELGGILANRGRYAEAESVLVQTITLARKLRGPQHPDVAPALSWLGTVHRMLGRFGKAEALFREAIAINEATGDTNHPRLDDDIDALGMVLAARGRDEEASTYFQRALAMRRRIFGEEHIETAFTMGNVARNLASLGRFAEAESLQWRAFRINERLLGPGNVAMAHQLLPIGFLHLGRNQYRSADSLITEALRILRSTVGDENVMTVIAFADAGLTRTTVRDFNAAETLLARGYDVASKVHGHDHGLTLLIMSRQALLHQELGDFARAERLFRDALEREARGGAPYFSALSYDLSAVLRRLGRYAEAERVMRQRLEQIDQFQEYDRFRASLEMGIVLRLTGKLEEGRRHQEEALTLAPKMIQPTAHIMGVLRAELGRTLIALGHHARGDSLLRSGIRSMEAAHNSNDPSAAEARVALAMSLVRRGRVAEGRQLLRASLPVLTQMRGVPDPIVAEARSWWLSSTARTTP